MAKQERTKTNIATPKQGNVTQNTGSIVHATAKESKFVNIGYVGAGGSGVNSKGASNIPDFGGAAVAAAKLAGKLYDESTAEERGDEVHRAKLEGHSAALQFESDLAADTTLSEDDRLARRIQGGIEAGYQQGFKYAQGQDAFQAAFRGISTEAQADQDVGVYNENIQGLAEVLGENWRLGNLTLPDYKKELAKLPLSRANAEIILSNSIIDEANSIHSNFDEQQAHYNTRLAEATLFVQNNGNLPGTARLKKEHPNWDDKQINEAHVQGILKKEGVSTPLQDLSTLIEETKRIRLDNGKDFATTTQGKAVQEVFNTILTGLQVDARVFQGKPYDAFVAKQKPAVQETWFAKTMTRFQQMVALEIQGDGTDYTNYFEQLHRSMPPEMQNKAARLLASQLNANVEGAFNAYTLDRTEKNIARVLGATKGISRFWNKTIMTNPVLFAELENSTAHKVSILAGLGIAQTEIPALLTELSSSDIKTQLGRNYDEKFREMQQAMTEKGGISFAATDDQAKTVINTAMWVASKFGEKSVDDVVNMMFPSSRSLPRDLAVTAYPLDADGLTNMERNQTGAISVAVSHIIRSRPNLLAKLQPLLGTGDWGDFGGTVNITELHSGQYSISISEGAQRMHIYVTEAEMRKASKAGFKLMTTVKKEPEKTELDRGSPFKGLQKISADLARKHGSNNKMPTRGVSDIIVDGWDAMVNSSFNMATSFGDK